MISCTEKPRTSVFNHWSHKIKSSHCSCYVFVDYSASLGSEEESGKDWDELEEEARKGLYLHTVYMCPSNEQRSAREVRTVLISNLIWSLGVGSNRKNEIENANG